MGIIKKNKKNDNDQQLDFLEKEAIEEAETAPEYTLDIPEEDIWTYQIEGLQAPHINQPYHNAKIKKVIVVIVLLIAISCSIFLSVRAVHNDEYKYKQLEDSTYQLVKYTNPGEITEFTVDYVNKDKSMPITSINQFAFNCDEKLTSVTISKDVKEIDSKSFYSCWALQAIYVDDENPYYCDVDGVLYTKDMTRIIHYPEDHDKYLRAKYGYDKLIDDKGNPMEELWDVTEKYDQKFLDEYNLKVRTYVLPSSVTTIGELAFAYTNIIELYIPEGLKSIEAMGIYENTIIKNIYSYIPNEPITDTSYNSVSKLTNIYPSLPNTLEYIGADAFSYDSSLTYMFIPKSIKEIGHHAFWDVCFKEDKELKGITQINTDATEEEFKNVKTGDQWRPQYEKMLLKRSIDVNYSVERAAVTK